MRDIHDSVDEGGRGRPLLTPETVLLGVRVTDKAEAITQAGNALVRAGCVTPAYVTGMLAREATMSTYLGNGIALPHGRLDDLKTVRRTGISVVQLPEGITWEADEKVYLVIGLAVAPASQEHTAVLSNLLDLLQEPDAIRQLAHTTDAMTIVERLTHTRSEA